MTKLSILLVLLLCMQPDSSQLKITQIPLEDVIHENKTKVSAFGVGNASSLEMARNRALKRAYTLLSGNVNGYQFVYKQNEDSYEVNTTANGELGFVTNTEYELLSENPVIVFLTVSKEHQFIEYEQDNTYAIEVDLVINDVRNLVSELDNKIGQAIHEFANMHDKMWTNGVAYFHDIKVQKKDINYDVTFTLVLVPDEELLILESYSKIE